MSTSAIFPPPEAAILETYEAPARVTFVWPQGPRTGILHVAWRKGVSLKGYLHEHPLRRFPLLAMWKRCRKYNKKKERVNRLTYVPQPDDVIVFQSAPRVK